jgi:tetratricopeptide (TPR) repeat protein
VDAGARRAKSSAELIGEQLSGSGARARAAAPVRWGRIAAGAAAIIVPALAVISAVRFDPWAGDGCPKAVDKGADCSRYGVAGRTFSALALLKVDRELDSSHWASAKTDLEPILRIRPNFAAALDARGEAEAGLGDTTAALADYGRVLTLTPDDLTTRAKRGQLYQSLGRTGEAAADFALIYHADPSTPRRDSVVAYVQSIDHSTPRPKAVAKPPKRKHRQSVDAGPAPEPSPPPAEQPPQTSPSGET